MESIKASDLIKDDRFAMQSNMGNKIYIFHGCGLAIQVSSMGIRIKKQGISCALIHTNYYTMEHLEHLIKGLQLDEH